MNDTVLSENRPPRAKWLNYGGLIIAVAILANFAAWAFFYSYGVFIEPLSKQLGGSRSDASIPPMIYLLTLSLSSPIVGGLLDKFSIRRIMLGATFMMAAGIMLLSKVQVQWQFYLIVALIIGLSVQALGTLSTSRLLVNWFVNRRGLALGLAAAGLSAAGILMPLLSAWSVALVGWKNSYLFFGGALLLVVAPIIALVVHNRPEDIGLKKDFNSYTPEASNEAVDESEVMTTRQILTGSTFWKLVFVVGIPAGVFVAMVTHSVPYATDYGISRSRAATILSMIGVVALFAKPGWGWLADRFDSRVVIMLALSIQAFGVALFVMGDSFWTLYIAACVSGLGMGSVAPFQGVLFAKAFGLASFGKVLGYSVPATLPFTMGFIYLAGKIYDSYGSYDPAFYLFIMLYGVGALIATQLKLSK